MSAGDWFPFGTTDLDFATKSDDGDEHALSDLKELHIIDKDVMLCILKHFRCFAAQL